MFMYTQVKGVKGPSWLCRLKSFDFIKGMSLDYMHCALLGVSKLLLNLWTDTARCRSTNHNLHADVKILDERIAQITVPSEIRRKPRGISDMKGWHIIYHISLHSVCLLYMYYLCLHSIRIQIVGPILWHTCPQRHIK